jgi:hypothetical protein
MVYPPAGIPVSTGTAWGTSIVNNSTNWNTAYSWGNHALAGYLTSAAIGVTVQPYNANTVIDGSYVHTDNNYTTAEKSKLAGIQAGAEVNVNADWNAVSGDAQILNKPTIPLVDTAPTSGSTNAVSSGGVFTALSFKADLVGGKVPAIQLPSYVDDVLEGYYNGTSFFIDSGFSTVMTPETGKIYINLLNNTSYRYTGSVYVQISNTVSSLNDLTDVTIGTLNNGQILQYNGTTSQWENVSVTIGSGDMQKSVYDIDNDGVVDYAETIAVDVRNNSSSDTLYRGTIVYLSGSTGTHPNAVKAQANSEATSSGTFGVVINDIGPNSDGLVAAMGTLHNLDTRTGANGNPNPFTSDTLLDGDVLWLDPNTAGYVTKTKPSAPNHAVFIGIVARTSPTNGRIIYRIQNGYELEELHNVAISNIQPNQVIKYDGTKWINATTPAAGNNTEIQYNNNGSLGASSNFTWDNVNQTLNLITPIGNLSPSLLLKATDVNATGQYNITQSTLKSSGGGGGTTYNLLSELTFDSYANNNYINTPLKISNVLDVSSSSTVLTSSIVTVNGSLKIVNIPTTVTTANGILGITDEGTLFKTSLGSSLTLSNTGTLDVSTLPFNKITAGQAQLSGSQNIAINYSNSNSGLLVSNSGYSVLGSPDGLKTLTVDNTGVYTTSSTAIGTNSINPNAILSLNSTTKGLLLPAVNDTDRGLMNLPSNGIMIYNPSVGKFQGRAGNAWVDFGGGSAAGNTGEIQFNNAGAFGASSNLFWNNTNSYFGVGLNNPTALIHIRKNDLGETISDANGLVLENATAPPSNNSTQQYSPSITLIGNAARSGARAITKTRLVNTSTLSGGGSFIPRFQFQIDAGTGTYSNVASFSLDTLGVSGSGALGISSVNSTSGNTLFLNGGAQSGYSIAGVQVSNSSTGSGGDLLSVTRSFSSPSQSVALNYINVSGTINLTGTASSITRGLNIAPTLTSAPNWRSIEWSNNTGWGLYGAGTANNYLAGSLGIGTVNISAALHVKGANNLVTTAAVLVQNSDDAELFRIANNGLISVGKNVSVSTQSSSQISVTSGDASTNIVITPKGTGAFILGPPPDGVATLGGNARGVYAVDLQSIRTAAIQVASGSYASAVGGWKHRASGDRSSVFGGEENSATALYSSVFGGDTQTASGQYSVVVGGSASTASGLRSVVLGGGSNASSATLSYSFGQYATSNLYGGQTYSSARFGSTSGTAQTMSWRYMCEITGTGISELSLDGAAISAQGRATLVANRLWNVNLQVSAICSTVGNGTLTLGDSYVATYQVGIKRLGNTTTLVGIPQLISTQSDSSMSTSVVTISADDSTNNECLKVEFTPPTGGAAGSTTVIRVVVTATATVVGY